MLKMLIKKTLPQPIIKYIQRHRGMNAWRQRNYLDNAPHFVKCCVLEKHAIAHAPWVETGTYMGDTTEFLAKNYPHVYTIEPEINFYKNAMKRFMGKNVTLYNGVSEDILPGLLPDLSGDLNFWLDGHYSGGETFKGERDCPVEDELKEIENNLQKLGKIVIFIDDVRCFLAEDSEYSDYPSVDYLVDFARKHDMRWRIEHDIFIMKN